MKTEDEWGRPFKRCDNPACDRLVKQGTMYCCSTCGLAHDGGWEIHEPGPLGHSDGCNLRHAARGHAVNTAITGERSESE